MKGGGPTASVHLIQLPADQLCSEMKHLLQVGAPARPALQLAKPRGLIFFFTTLPRGWRGALDGSREEAAGIEGCLGRSDNYQQPAQFSGNQLTKGSGPEASGRPSRQNSRALSGAHHPCPASSCVCTRSVAQSCPTLCNPWTVAHQAPVSMEFSGKNTRASCQYWHHNC